MWWLERGGAGVQSLVGELNVAQDPQGADGSQRPWAGEPGVQSVPTWVAHQRGVLGGPPYS